VPVRENPDQMKVRGSSGLLLCHFLGDAGSGVALSVELSSKHSTTMYFEHTIHTYPPVIIVDTSENGKIG
jgi:hypothetical protein